METVQISLVIFQEAGQAVEVRLDASRETVWLSQRQMADLFETSTDNISLHLKNVFAEGELNESATTEDSSVVQPEGKRRVARTVRQYNLDAIISVGYRVSSKRAVLFRQWATRVLREHLIPGPRTAENHNYQGFLSSSNRTQTARRGPSSSPALAKVQNLHIAGWGPTR